MGVSGHVDCTTLKLIMGIKYASRVSRIPLALLSSLIQSCVIGRNCTITCPECAEYFISIICLYYFSPYRRYFRSRFAIVLFHAKRLPGTYLCTNR